MTGQQHARDALMILTSYGDSWPDLFNFLCHTTQQTITCLTCQGKSFYDEQKLYSEHYYPEHGSSLKTFLEFLANQGEEIEEYRCENCQTRVNAKKQLQLKTEQSSAFFIVVLSRDAQNYANVVTATEDLILIDSESVPRVYSPLSVIHHRGGIGDENASARHYMCDVRNKDDKTWYYTSDASEPKKISPKDVTKKPYVVLYMRKK